MPIRRPTIPLGGIIAESFTAGKPVCSAFLLAVVMAASVCLPQNMNIAIGGRVANSGGNPVSGALVHLQNAGLTATTDSDGSFLLAGVISPVADDIGQILPRLLDAAQHNGVLYIRLAMRSEVTVTQAINLWDEMTSRSDIRIVSPAVSGDGRAWMDDFIAQVEANNLRVDVVAIHWYGWNAGSCNNSNQLEGHINWAEGFGRPIWITEFGCLNQSAPSPDVVENFFVQAISMLKDHPMVERYAWYPWADNHALVNEDGSLTSLGQTFQSASSTR
ncbi:MAG: hypothetical protein JXA18_07700 [Chitinispirillaceae bacterium]|nr:hypothetical protein [Chitinispirillaceae bacterium]